MSKENTGNRVWTELFNGCVSLYPNATCTLCSVPFVSNVVQRVYYCRLERGKRERLEEDTLVSKLIVNALLRRATLGDEPGDEEEKASLQEALGLNASAEEYINVTSLSLD